MVARGYFPPLHFHISCSLSPTPLTTLGPRWEDRVDGRTTLGPMLVSLRTEFMADVYKWGSTCSLIHCFLGKWDYPPQQPGRLYPQSLTTT